MAENSKNAPTLLKTFGGVAFLFAAVGLFIHRLPKTKYVEVHADKPRPTATLPAAMLVTGAPAKPKAPAAKPAAGASSRPASRGLVSQPSAAFSSGGSDQAPEALEDWQDVCSAEIGILCNSVRVQSLPRCLRRYDDAIRGSCLKSLLLLGQDPRAADL